MGVTVVVSSQHYDNKWQRGNFGFKMIILRKWTGGEFQNNTFLTEGSYHDCS